MNSSFPNRWSFSYLKFTKYVTNIIAEPKYKHRQQEQKGTTTEVPPWNGQYKNTGGLKPVLRAPNLALSFYHGSKHTVVRSAWRFSNSSMDHHVKQINQINTMMKQRWGLDRNVLRPTPGDPWGVEQHHWNTGAEENQQLNPGGPSNRQKSSGPNQPK